MTLECSGSGQIRKTNNRRKSIEKPSKKYDLVIILVAHSNKSSLMNREPHVFEISGASEIPNLANYVFKAYRDTEKVSNLHRHTKNRITGIVKHKLSIIRQQPQAILHPRRIRT